MITKVKESKQSKVRFTKRDLVSYKDKLVKLKNTIVKQITGIAQEALSGSSKDGSGNNAAYGLHMADAASDNYDRDFNLGIASNERKVVFEIDEALKRIEEGTFGVCQISGKPIPKARLNAIPYARYTRECQEQYDRENRFQRVSE